MSYIVKAPAKINIGLDVIRKRPDGYHDLKMIMQTITLFDILEFELTDEKESSMVCTSPELPVNEDNLVIKAVNLMKERYNITENVKVKLTKNIPVAAGMAGGSTDAAACFTALNDIFNIGADKKELMELSVQLGADIPYCIMQGTALAEGIGDILTGLAAFEEAVILIAKPPVDVSTGYVYKNLKIDKADHPDIDGVIRALESKDYAEMSKCIGNILESVTIPAFPVIDKIKKVMLDNNACISLMSGSGPTVFGLFSDENTAKAAEAACKKVCENMFTAITAPYNP